MTQPADGAQSGATDTQSGAGQTDESSTSNTGTATPPEGGQASQTDSTQSGVSREEYESLRARMQAADKRASDREAELRQIKDKDLPAIDRLTRDNTELTKQVETLRGENTSLKVSNAFLSDNTYSWHDPAAAQRLLDMSKVEVDDSGNVTGLKVALKALADANPWMLKPKDDAGAGDQKQVGVPPLNGAGGSRKDGQASKEDLAKRFPALRSRLG